MSYESPTDDDMRTLRLAVSDPGAFLRRGNNYTEPLPSWIARAIVLAGWRPVAAPSYLLQEDARRGAWGDGEQSEDATGGEQ